MKRVSLGILVLLLASGALTCDKGGGGNEEDATADACSCLADAACTALDPACEEPIPCEDDAACEDDNPCTLGACLDGFCVFQPSGAAGCCTADADCVVEHECLSSACVDGRCAVTQADPLCCVKDMDCDDLDPCTGDSCADGLCAHTEIESCCRMDTDCDDGDPCSRDRCVAAECIHPVWEDETACICTSTGDCDDGNMCTVDQCLASHCSYQQALEGGGCCGEDTDCDDGDDTTVDFCVEFLCVNQHTKTCMVDLQCDDGDPCTEDLCIVGHCNVTVSPDPLCCATDGDCDDGSACSLDACVEGTCTHDPDLQKPGCCNKGEMCDDGIACTQDVCASWTCDWIPQEEGCCHDGTDCPAASKPCQEAICQLGACQYENQPGCCNLSAQCDDGDPCTEDVCDFGQCFWYEDEDCCVTDADCEDDNLCTETKCQGGTCGTPKIIEDCCTNPGMCNDSDPCTIDTCSEDNTCSHAVDPDCCYEDWECNDEKQVECQVPHCVNGNCVLTLGEECCLTDTDCADFDPECTLDSCGEDNLCIHALADIPGCCLEDADCVAEDPCLTGDCKTNHQCVFAPDPDCCNEDAECDDGDDLCTVDLCVENSCIHQLTDAEGCCLADTDCVPSDICLDGVCGGDHLCTFPEIPNCCHNDLECDDGDDLCTTDSCVNDQCQHIYTGAEGCCEEDADCKDPDPCAVGHCDVPSGLCTFTMTPAPACCHDDAECSDGDDLCTEDTCVANVCDYKNTGAEGCCEPFTWESDFEDGTGGGFTFENFGMPIPIPGFDFFPAWSVSTACGATSGTAALYYGLDAGLMTPGCSYLMNFMGFTMPSSGTAHSPVITLPPDQGYHATMKLMASISAAPAVDSFTISVKPAGGAPVVLLTKADITTGASWKDVSLDLGPWAGQQIQLSFFFDDLGNTTPGGTGVLVDDLSFTADCNPD